MSDRVYLYKFQQQSIIIYTNDISFRVVFSIRTYTPITEINIQSWISISNFLIVVKCTILQTSSVLCHLYSLTKIIFTGTVILHAQK